MYYIIVTFERTLGVQVLTMLRFRICLN